jgi:S1-C subfamily serine protease
MKKNIFGLVTVVVMLFIFVPAKCAAQDSANEVLKQRKRYTLSIALAFNKKKRNVLERTFSLIFNGITPNAYATGFLIDDGLVMTAYHTVSGELSPSKRKLLGFKPDDELQVHAYINNCLAKVVKIDKQADLALLRVCDSSKQATQPTFQTNANKDERLWIIAQQGSDKVVRRGSLQGIYTFRGQQYLSIKAEGQDGFSGSPVYNYKGEVIGVFCLYDWANGLAILSPGINAKKLVDDYYAETHIKPTQ